MIKTNVAKSPLLRPVIERDYTKGMILPESSPPPPPPPPDPGPKPGSGATDEKPGGAGSPGPGPGPGPGSQFNIPPDDTKEFRFDDIPEEGEITGDEAPGMSITSASAKSFANFAGNALQVYLPRLTYNYCKIDMDSVIMNIEKQLLNPGFKDTFENINANTEEKLKIPDEEILMWKKACKEWLESENISFANPRTAFIAATILLIGTHGYRAYQIHSSNIDLMRQALEHSRPDLFIKTEKKVDKPEKDDKDERKAA